MRSADHDVTHLCGAPDHHVDVASSVPAAAERRPLPRKVEFVTAAAPPPAAVLEALERRTSSVTHVYGLTEVYGPATICAWHDEWDAFDSGERRGSRPARACATAAGGRRHRHGPSDHGAECRATARRWARSCSAAIIVMKGYLKNPQGDRGGLRTAAGSIPAISACCTPTAISSCSDRSKDIIISGGENISSIEVEDVLYKHPAVASVAVVGKPDEKWGETPCAFVDAEARGQSATAEEIIAHCRANLASYKCPRFVVFRDLPMTSTGKVQKYVLREWAEDRPSSHHRAAIFD